MAIRAETTYLTYAYIQYERFIHRNFTGYTANDIKGMITESYSDVSAETRTKVLKVINVCKFQKNITEFTEDASIYTMAWKLAKSHYDDKEWLETMDETYFNPLMEDYEENVTSGLFNENSYIESCKKIKDEREHDTALLEICSCSCLGNIKKQNGKNSTIAILCLPCFWNDKSNIRVSFS